MKSLHNTINLEKITEDMLKACHTLVQAYPYRDYAFRQEGSSLWFLRQSESMTQWRELEESSIRYWSRNIEMTSEQINSIYQRFIKGTTVYQQQEMASGN